MTVIVFVIVLAVLILVHEFGHFIIAKRSGIRVDEFGLGFPPRVFGFKPKNSETTYSINWIPFGGFVKIFGESPDEESMSGPDSARSLINKPKSVQAFVMAGGILFNFILAWVIFSVGFMTGLPYSVEGRYEDRVGEAEVIITSVLGNSPAEEAGISPGDNILSVGSSGAVLDGEVLSVEEIQNQIANSGGNTITLFIEHVGEPVSIKVKPEKGVIGDVYAIGISMAKVGTLKLPFHLAVWEGLRLSGSMFLDIIVGISNLIYKAITGTGSLAGIAGPVGIAGLIGDASKLGFIHLMAFTAFISLNLAVLNLIPFPALDGGRLLLILIEKLKGSPINPKVTNMLNAVGFFILVAFLFVVTYNDILRLF